MERDEEAKQLREEVALLGPRTPSRRFPAELKARIERWARARMEAGASSRELDVLLDVPWESLGKWMRAAGAQSAGGEVLVAEPRLRPVRVVASRPSTGQSLLVRTPKGFTVEGLDVAATAELLSRLG